MYDMFNSSGCRQIDLNIRVPLLTLQCQRTSFIYQSTLFWNRLYKNLLTPFTIPLHNDYVTKHNLTSSVSIHYDYCTKITVFKSKLHIWLCGIQDQGDISLWNFNNHINIF